MANQQKRRKYFEIKLVVIFNVIPGIEDFVA